MMRGLKVIFIIMTCTGTALGQAAIPDTPAGHVLAAWVDAFNSGDRARIDGFLKSYAPGFAEGAFASARFRGQSGGVNVVAITHSEPLSIDFRMEEKAHPTTLLGKIVINKPANAPTIENFNLRVVPPGATLEDITLDAALRRQVIEDVIGDLDRFYVYPEMAQKMAASLHAHEESGDYTKITNGDAFASLLTKHLLDISHDKHIAVFYNPFTLTADPHPVNLDEMMANRKAMARDCGIRRLEILPNNIGYMKVDFFADPSACGLTAAAAMSYLANVDAVIFDLRENSGGDPRMVAVMCTYLFDRPVHLSDYYDRRDGQTTEYWTQRYVPGLRLGNKPAYVLTSARTFSGAEQFAYDLKNLKRVTVVGETTAGGSHPVSPYRAGDHFTIYVPNARSINPVTKTDWEGTGVTPDVRVKAEDALATAERLAEEGIEQNPSGATNLQSPH
jgi:retinol-binding protein 3